MRIDNLPDGCNRLDEPWSRDHINGPDYEEIFDLTGPITKEEFKFFFEDEIEEQNKREVEFDKIIEDHFHPIVEEMIPHHREFSIGRETVGFSAMGALSGEEVLWFSIEDNKTLLAIKAYKKASLGEEVNWWEIYSTQEEVDAAIARVKRACRTKIIKIEMDIVIN